MIFLFKYDSEKSHRQVDRDGALDFAAADDMFFASQTIQNACGTQALLSVLLNWEADVDIGPQLKTFKDFTKAFPAEVSSLRIWLRAILIELAAPRRGTLKLGGHP